MASADTKGLISQSFKRLMMKKPFDKITISDISEECGINRQTFYYHFHDKYELLNSTFYNEVIAELVEGLTIDNWYEKFLGMLITIKNDAKFYRNALNVTYGGEFRNYLLDVSKNLLYDIVGHLVGEKTLSDSDRMFVAKFYAFGVSGIIIDWVTTGMKQSPEEVTHLIKKIIEDSSIAILSKQS